MEPFMRPFTTAQNRIHRPFMVSIYRTPSGDYRVLLAGTVGALWAGSLGDAMALAYSLTSTLTLG